MAGDLTDVRRLRPLAIGPALPPHQAEPASEEKPLKMVRYVEGAAAIMLGNDDFKLVPI